MSGFDVLALTQDVAAELGDDWGVATSEERPEVVLVGPGGERIIPRGKGWGGAKAGQLNWWGQLGPTLHQFGNHHSINVGADRGARVIAAEIVRRLLPPYRATLVQARRKAEQAAEDARRQVGNLYRLAGALPGGTVVDRGRVLFDNGGQADVSQDGCEVGFSLPSVPFDRALRVAAALRNPQTDEAGRVRVGQ